MEYNGKLAVLHDISPPPKKKIIYYKFINILRDILNNTSVISMNVQFGSKCLPLCSPWRHGVHMERAASYRYFTGL